MPAILRRSRWTTKPKIRDPELAFAHPLSAGLVGAWILGLAPASATLRDPSGNGNHGTLFGTSIARVNYRGGRALFFNGDGNTDRYDLGSIDSANRLCLSGDVLTFVAGFRLQQSGLGNTFPRVLDKSDGAGLVNGYGFYIDDGVGDDYRFDVNGATYGSNTLTGNDKYRYQIACVTKNGGTLTFFKEAGDQTNCGQVGGTSAIPSTTTDAAIGNWNHTTDRNWQAISTSPTCGTGCSTPAPGGRSRTTPVRSQSPACRAAPTWHTASRPRRLPAETAARVPS